MKRTVLILLCFLILAFFQFSFANTNETDTQIRQFFSSPEHTWSLFKEAILDGDFDTAHKCCCNEKNNGVLKFEKMDPKKRMHIVQSMQELEKILQQENKAKYKLVRNSNGVAVSTFVYFEKIDDEWKIENF